MSRDEDFAEQQQWWNTVLGHIGEQSDRIADQLDQAGGQHPELVAAFNLMLAYVGHLHTYMRETLPPAFQLYGLPERFCEHNRLICMCANGDESVCKILGGGFVEVAPEAPDCAELWRQYLEAKAKERDELLKAMQVVRETGKPLQVADPAQHLTLITVQKESERLLQNLRARRCLIATT